MAFDKLGNLFVSGFSTASDGQANDASSNPWLSGDGSAVAFQSVATNLVPEDTDNTNDVYVRGPSMAQ